MSNKMQAAISAREIRAPRRGLSSGRTQNLMLEPKTSMKWDKGRKPPHNKKTGLKGLIKDVATVVVPRTKINNNINNNYNTFNINNIFKHPAPKKKRKSKGNGKRNRADEDIGLVGEEGLAGEIHRDAEVRGGRVQRASGRRGVTAGGKNRGRRKDMKPSDSKKYFYKETDIQAGARDKPKKKKKKSGKNDPKRKSRKSPPGHKALRKTTGKKKLSQKIKRAKSIEKVNAKSKQLLRNHRSIPNLKIRREERTDRKRKKRRPKDCRKHKPNDKQTTQGKRSSGTLGFFSIHHKDTLNPDLDHNLQSVNPHHPTNDRKTKKKVSSIFKNRRLEGRCFETMERTAKQSLIEKVKRLKFSELPKKSLKPKGKENKNSQPHLKNANFDRIRSGLNIDRQYDHPKISKMKKKENSNKFLNRGTSQGRKASRNYNKKPGLKNTAGFQKTKHLKKDFSRKNLRNTVGIGGRKGSKKDVVDRNRKRERTKSKSKQKVFFVLKKKKPKISKENGEEIKKSKNKSVRKKKIGLRKRREGSRKTQRMKNFENKVERKGESKHHHAGHLSQKSGKKLHNLGAAGKRHPPNRLGSQEPQKRTKRGLSQTGKLKLGRARQKNQISANQGIRAPATARRDTQSNFDAKREFNANRQKIRKLELSTAVRNEKRRKLKDGTVIKKEKKRTIEEFFEQMDLKKDRSAFSDLSKEQLAGLLLKARDVLKEYRREIEKKGTSRNPKQKLSISEVAKSFSNLALHQNINKCNKSRSGVKAKNPIHDQVFNQNVLFAKKKNQFQEKLGSKASWGTSKSKQQMTSKSKKSKKSGNSGEIKNIMIEPIALNSSISISEKELMEHRLKNHDYRDDFTNAMSDPHKIENEKGFLKKSNDQHVFDLRQIKYQDMGKRGGTQKQEKNNINWKHSNHSDTRDEHAWIETDTERGTNLPSLLENIVIRSKIQNGNRGSTSRGDSDIPQIQNPTSASHPPESYISPAYLANSHLENHEIHLSSESGSKSKKEDSESPHKKFFQQEGMRFTLGPGQKLKVLESAKKEKKKMFNIKFDSKNTLAGVSHGGTLISARGDQISNHYESEKTSEPDQNGYFSRKFKKIKETENLKSNSTIGNHKNIKNFELLEIRRDGSTRLEMESESIPYPSELHPVSLLPTRNNLEPEHSLITDIEPDFDTQNSNHQTQSSALSKFRNLGSGRQMNTSDTQEEEFCIEKWKARLNQPESLTENLPCQKKLVIETVDKNPKSKNHLILEIENSDNQREKSGQDTRKIPEGARANEINPRNPKPKFTTPINRQSQDHQNAFGNRKSKKYSRKDSGSNDLRHRYSTSKKQTSGMSLKELTQTLQQNDRLIDSERGTSLSAARRDRMYFKPDRLKDISKEDSLRRSMHQSRELARKRHLFKTFEESRKKPKPERRGAYSSRHDKMVHLESDTRRGESRELRNDSQVRAEAMIKNLKKYHSPTQDMIVSQHSLSQIYLTNRQRDGRGLPGAMAISQNPSHIMISNQSVIASRHIQIVADYTLSNNNSLRKYPNFKTDSKSAIFESKSFIQNSNAHSRILNLSKQKINTNSQNLIRDHTQSVDPKSKISKLAKGENPQISELGTEQCKIRNDQDKSSRLQKGREENKKNEEKRGGGAMDRSMTNCSVLMRVKTMQELGLSQVNLGKRQGQLQYQSIKDKLRGKEANGKSNDKSQTKSISREQTKSNETTEQGIQKTEHIISNKDIEISGKDIDTKSNKTALINLKNLKIRDHYFGNSHYNENNSEPFRNLKISAQMHMSNLKQSKTISEIDDYKPTINHFKNNDHRNPTKTLPPLEIERNASKPETIESKKLSLTIPDFPKSNNQKITWNRHIGSPTESRPRGNMLPGRRDGEVWSKVHSDLSIAKNSESGRIETDVSQIYQDSISKNDTPFNDKTKSLSFKQSQTQSLAKLNSFASGNLNKRPARDATEMDHLKGPNPGYEELTPVNRDNRENCGNSPFTPVPRKVESKTSINPLLTLGSDSSPILETKNSECTPKEIEMLLARNGTPFAPAQDKDIDPSTNTASNAPCFQNLMEQRIECEISQCHAPENSTLTTKQNINESPKSQFAPDPTEFADQTKSRESIQNQLRIEIGNNFSKSKNNEHSENQNVAVESEQKEKALQELQIPNNIAQKKFENSAPSKEELKKLIISDQQPKLMDLNYFKEKEPIQNLPPFNVISTKPGDLQNFSTFADDLGTFRAPNTQHDNQKQKIERYIKNNVENQNCDLGLDIGDKMSALRHLVGGNDVLTKLSGSEEGRKAIEDMIIVSLVENFLEDSLYKEIFLPSAESSDGIDTSLNRVSQYVAEFIEYLKNSSFKAEVISNLNKPLGPSTLQKMSFFHEALDDSGTMSVNYNYQTILPIEIFLDFEQFSKSKRGNPLDPEDPSESLKRIHDKMIFDCLNEALDSRRVLGLKGSPLPVDMLKATGAWTSRYLNRPQSFDLEQILTDTTQQISKWSSFLCGMFEYKPENLKYISELESAQEIETMKEQRMNLLELAEMQEQAQKMNDCDDELYEINLQLNDMVFDSLLTDIIQDLSSISEVKQKKDSGFGPAMTATLVNNTTQIPSEDVVTNLDCFANFSSSQTLKNPINPEMHSSSQWPRKEAHLAISSEPKGPWTTLKQHEGEHRELTDRAKKVKVSLRSHLDTHNDHTGSRTDRSRQNHFKEAFKRNSLNEGTRTNRFHPETEEVDHNIEITKEPGKQADQSKASKAQRFDIVVSKTLSLKIKKLKKISLRAGLKRRGGTEDYQDGRKKSERLLTT